MAYRTQLRYLVLLLPIFIIVGQRNLVAAGDENWDDLIGNPGVVGGTVVAQHQGELYLFGGFPGQEGFTPNIGRWEAGLWSFLGNGIGGESHVVAMASDGSSLYAGGYFSSIGGVSVRNFARWDGTNWSTVGGGVNGLVRAIAVSGNNVFVGGSFTEAGGIPATNVARWDGRTWSALGNGIVPVDQRGERVGAVDALAVDGSDLIVGGRFRKAGSIGATNIARWTGSEWQALG